MSFIARPAVSCARIPRPCRNLPHACSPSSPLIFPLQKPNDYTFSGLIMATVGARRVTEIRQLMAEHGVSDTVHTYNALIAAYDRSGAYDKALGAFTQMKLAGIAPNKATLQMMSLVGERGVSRIEAAQTNLAAFSAAAAALGAALMRAGFL